MPENFERGPTPPLPESAPDPTQEGATSEMDKEGALEEGRGVETEFEAEVPFEEKEEMPAEQGEDITDKTQEELQGKQEKEEGEQKEDSSENEEKRQKLEEIREKVATGFESAKERMEAIKQRYDGLFQKGRETFAYFKEKYPKLISDAGLQRLDDANDRVKDRFDKMYQLYKGSGEKLQSMLQALPAEFISKEQIEMLDMGTDRLFETINRGEAMIEERLDRLEMTVSSLPPIT